MAPRHMGSVWLTSPSLQRPLDVPLEGSGPIKTALGDVTRPTWRADWWERGGGQALSFYRRPCPACKSYTAPLTARRRILDTVHISSSTPLNGPHGGAWPHPLVSWWILCRGRRRKTPNSFIKKRRRIRKERKFSQKTWRLTKDTNSSGAASRSASSRWFPRRPPVGLLFPPQI